MSFVLKVRKKANIRNQYNQVPHLTWETIWESDKTHDKVFFEVSHNVIRTKSKKEGKDRESIQSSINFDMGHHMGK